MDRISIAAPVFNGNEKKYLNECIDTGWVSANGRFIKEFEKKFAEYCGCKYAIACCNGTVTLHVILAALGIGPGDEVIMPTLTYIATANAVKYCGGTPVFVDSEKGTFNMDPKKIEEKITEKTKVIMPVHLYGLPADMDPIVEIAKKHNLVVVEDAAEAHGAEYKGKRVGAIGKVGSFSFFGNKIITCGEGGMIVTDDKELYDKMVLLKAQGVSPEKRYWHNMVAYNYRMTNMQAAVGLGQLERIDWHLGQRKRIAELYKKYLKGFEEYMVLQEEPAGCKSVYWMSNVILQPKVKKQRDQVMAEMEARNIEMRPVFYPMHIMPPYYDETVNCPVAEEVSARGISLPSHALLTEDDIKYICESMKEIVKEP
jgi:perosamine synthetase